MYQCQLCEDQDEEIEEEMMEKYEKLFKKELEVGIVKESIPILIKAIVRFKSLVNPSLINIATQVVISMAEDEIEKQNIEENEEQLDNDNSNKDISDEDYQDKEIVKIRLPSKKTAPKKKL